MGLSQVRIEQNVKQRGAIWSSDWILVSADDAFLAHPLVGASAAEIPADMRRIVFTDQKSSLISLLRAW
jgi:hypothetical protein